MSSHAPPVFRPEVRRTVPDESWSRIVPARIDVLVARTATRWPALPLKFARELPPAEVTAPARQTPRGPLRLRRRWTQDVQRAASVRAPWERTESLPPQMKTTQKKPAR